MGHRSGLDGWANLLCVILALGSACATRASPVVQTANSCSERSPAACEPACFAGDGAACGIFGAAVEGMADPPIRLPQDLPRGRRALSYGCQRGNQASCRTLASYDYDSAGPSVACPAWGSACDRGEQRACAFFASCLIYEKDFRHDPPRGLTLLNQGCQRGERVSCRELGYVFRRGELVPRDLARSFTYLDYACRQDDPMACSEAARALEVGNGTAVDLERAKSLYRLACARGIRPVPCTALRRLGEEPPSTVVSTAAATESIYVSRAFQFEWRIAADWEFVLPPATGVATFTNTEEVVSAQARAGGPAESLTIGIRNEEPTSFDDVERDATAWMQSAGVEKTGSSRDSFFHTASLRLDGLVTGPKRQFLTLVVFYRGRHRFELRCLTPHYQAGMICRDAFGGLIFSDGYGPGAVPGG